jgi:RNA polymerase sigma-70 factor, ECF subfamily
MPADQLADTISGMSVDECALMDRIATGDPGALETLYYRFHPKLARFLWRLIGRREGLEEIINDTFVDVCIAYCNALENLCQQRGSSAGYNMQHPPEQAKDAVDDAELSDALSQELRAVPFEQRLALLLTYQMGYGPDEIAAITGVSAATVNARMLCARTKLRRHLPALAGAGIVVAAPVLTDIHPVSTS